MKPEIGERVTVVEVSYAGERLLRGVVDRLADHGPGFYVTFHHPAVDALYPAQEILSGAKASLRRWKLPPKNLVFGLPPHSEGIGWCRGWEGENVEAMLVARGLE